MRVATYNVHRGLDLRGWPRPEPMRRVIVMLGAEIVALQEALSWRRGRDLIGLEELALSAGLVAVPVAGAPGWRGNVLLVRRGIRLLHAEGLPIGGWEPRGAILAELQLAHGMLRVVGTHLSLRRGTRRHQAMLLLDAIRRRPCMPTVLLGDLNEWRAGQGALGVLEPVFGRAPRSLTFPAPRPLLSLDRILGDRPGLVRDIAPHDAAPARRASDHLPLVGRIVL
ncbi:endonuclease/exonuclease/phosphatase family protein [Falsiroseomonas oryziterrae]|uniref:endonuclease/exonuclease/phosphatase family protein n=1 Tax=Falsiroseomonas oryziterrae TaxID=2911368 RepID=UPI001F2BDDF0|nr:endonuclease/exonuclease/phosphatase family protein [Roseomonas sp. NPKOSM-4]